jgi:dihydrofolate reductase
MSDVPSRTTVARTRYYCAASLDGYIAEADDTIEWLTGYEGRYEGNGAQPIEGGYDDFYAGIGALVIGSVTYEWILRHIEGGGDWPYSGKPCWILSSRTLPVPEGEGVDVRIVNAAILTCTARCLPQAATATCGSSAAGTSPPSSRMQGCSTRSP